jgi:hypothetical protein
MATVSFVTARLVLSVVSIIPGLLRRLCRRSAPEQLLAARPILRLLSFATGACRWKKTGFVLMMDNGEELDTRFKRALRGHQPYNACWHPGCLKKVNETEHPVDLWKC